MLLRRQSSIPQWVLFGSTTLILSSFTGALPNNNNNNNNNNNSNNNNNNNNIHNNVIPPSHYSVNQHVSFDPQKEQLHLSAETETMAFYNPIHPIHPIESENVNVNESSSDEACVSSTFISMESGMYQISNQEPSISTTLSHNPLSNVFDVEFDLSEFEESEDDESEDDDDDDDGHSMMLSNVSLRKSLLVSANSYDSNDSYNDASSNTSNNSKRPTQPSSPRIHRQPATTYSTHSTPFTKSKPSNAFSTTSHKIVSIRGGASTVQSSEFAKRLLVAALVTLLYEASLGHLLEFVKVVMQTSPSGTSYFDVLRIITSEKGIVGIWDGFVPWGVLQSIAKGGVFGLARAMALSILLPMVDSKTIPKLLALTLAGGIAGGFQGYVLSPTLLLKTRVMTNPIFRTKMSVLTTTLLSFRIGLDVVKLEGIGALMKGSNIFALKRVFDWSTRFYFSDIFATLMKRQQSFGNTHSIQDGLSSKQKIAADLLGGTASTLVTLPLDVLTTKSQDAKKAGVDVSAVQMFQEELREKGAKGLYDSYMRGFEARLLHVCFTTVAMKTGTGLMYDYLFKTN